MKRTIMRKHVFKILFRVEFHDIAELKEQEQLYLEGIEDISDKEMQYIADRAQHIIELIPDIDKKLEAVSVGWKIERLGKVELAILRLGIFEMLYDSDVPVNVALNEAVELAKTFGGDSSSSFVNGVLAKLVKQDS